MSDNFYAIWDLITEEGLSDYNSNPFKWKWDAEISEGHAHNFKLFSTREDALEVVNHLEQVFILNGADVNFSILTLYHPSLCYKIK